MVEAQVSSSATGIPNSRITRCIVMTILLRVSAIVPSKSKITSRIFMNHGIRWLLSGLQRTSSAIMAKGGMMQIEMPNHTEKEWFRSLAKNPLNSAHPK
jgi:hypothetical protein